MAVEYQLYRPKRVLNKYKRADHWFWTRYTAHPYMGCQHGCEYCYWRESKYCPYPDPEDFSRLIKVKINAPELLRKELSKVPVDVVGLGEDVCLRAALSPRQLRSASELLEPAGA